MLNKLIPVTGPQPTRATPGSAGHDIYAVEDAIIPAKGSYKFDSGIAAETESTATWVDVRSRSGWAWHHDIVAFHGLIDHDYHPQTIGIKLFNLGDAPHVIKKGERVAQLAFVKGAIDESCPVVEDKRTGGFQSTGA